MEVRVSLDTRSSRFRDEPITHMGTLPDLPDELNLEPGTGK
jgi:hypothetical protein